MSLQRVFTLFALILLLALLAGCAFLDELRLFKSGEEQPPAEEDQVTVIERELGQEQDEAAETAAETDTAGVNDAEAADPDAGPDQAVAPAGDGNSRQVLLYFAGADGASLSTETRSIPQQEGVARATLNELIAGPQTADLSPTLPAAALVEGMNIKDGICIVDFSGELVEHMSTDPSQQLLAVYSIVNTLTQFDTVDYVRILVDGQAISGGLGGVDLSAALAPVEL